MQNESGTKMSSFKNWLTVIEVRRWLGFYLRLAVARQMKKTCTKACSVESVKMGFVLRGSHCPHKHTHTGLPPSGSVVSGCGRVFDCEYRQGESRCWNTWTNWGFRVIWWKTVWWWIIHYFFIYSLYADVIEVTFHFYLFRLSIGVQEDIFCMFLACIITLHMF